MSQGFHAPEVIGTESRTKSASSIDLSDTLRGYKECAEEVYNKAIAIAEEVDMNMGLTTPLNQNAVMAASLLMLACVRGAQVS